MDEVVHKDVYRVDGVERNPDRMRNVLKSLARNISTLTTGETILKDLKTNDPTICDKTLSSYLNALRTKNPEKRELALTLGTLSFADL